MEGNREMNKTIHCGECEKFLYEDIDGYGICGKTNEDVAARTSVT